MRAILLFAMLLCFGSSASAQSTTDTFPSQPVRFVLPFLPGGLPDVLARILAQQLSAVWPHGVVVDNRPGASGITASEHVAKSSADGYTLLMADPQNLGINPAIFSKLPYDPVRDFSPVTLAAYGPLFLVVHPRANVSSFREFIDLAKSKPGTNYGSAGPGSIHHLAMETLKAALGIKLTHIPYKGGSQATPALIRGDVTGMFSAYPPIAIHVKSGKVKILATSTASRTKLAPEVPTIAELAVPGFNFGAQISFVAPAGTPRAVIAKLNADLVKVLRHPAVISKMNGLGIEPVGSTPEELAQIIRDDLIKFAKAAKLAGLRVE